MNIPKVNDSYYLDKEDEDYLLELSIRFNIQQKNTINKLSKKKKLKLNKIRKELKLNNVKMNIRNCLSCYQKFESQGLHNRLCDCCRQSIGFEL